MFQVQFWKENLHHQKARKKLNIKNLMLIPVFKNEFYPLQREF